MLRVLPLVLFATFAFAACDSDDSGPTVAASGSTVTVAYTGLLEDGTVFDQSNRTTFSLTRVIPGFREGIVGMRIGERKTFEVAPEDGYGATGVTNPNTGEVVIPPNATLTFEVDLIDIQ